MIGVNNPSVAQNLIFDSTPRSLEGLVVNSKALQQIVDQLKMLSASSSSVLITGETGTGKDIVAKLCHTLSQRPEGPFVVVNCAALPESLLESELFGHKKGSFTGATNDHGGLIAKANHGTLFLDEIGDMSLRTQAKLLRVAQNKMVRSIGSTTETEVDIRILSATHKNLVKACEKGDFRFDLYFRLSVIPLFIPPLRKRKEDILPLAKVFISKTCCNQKLALKKLSRLAEDRLLEYDWPGNVRELNNVIERGVVYTSGAIIEKENILFDYQYLQNSTQEDSEDKSDCSLKSIEAYAIQKALEKANGVKTVAARELGIDRKTLLRKKHLYGI